MRVDIAELGGRALRALLEGAAQSPDADGDMALAEPLVPQLMVRDSSVKRARGKARVPAASCTTRARGHDAHRKHKTITQVDIQHCPPLGGRRHEAHHSFTEQHPTPPHPRKTGT